MKKAKKFFFILSLGFLSLANLAFALEIKYPRIPGMPQILPPQEFLKKIEEGEIEPEKALALYAQYIFYLSLMVGGMVALGSITFGGIKYLIAFGNVQTIKEARARIGGGILGLLLMLFSYLFVTAINPQLAIFRIRKAPPPTPPPAPVAPKGKEAAYVYAEIPFAALIEHLEKQSKKASDIAVAIYNAGAEQEEITTAFSLKELSQCLTWLADKCNCSFGLTVECPKGYVEEDEEIPCDEAKCIGDPCDRNDLNELDLPEYCPPPIDKREDKTFNLRKKMDKIKEMATSKRGQLLAYKSLAEKQLPILKRSLKKLELAEALMRDARPIAASRREFIAEKSRLEGMGKKVQILRLPFWGPESEIETPGAGEVIEFPPPPKACCTNPPDDPIFCDKERTPSCVWCPCFAGEGCDYLMFCFGRRNVGCETEDLVPSVEEIEAAPKAHIWQSADTYEDGSVLFNGKNFPVPTGGVVTKNIIAPADPRCE